MYSELYQYLILNRQLNIPGIGTFQLERTPAEPDFASKLIHPPSFTIALHHGQSNTPTRLFNWLAAAMNISERDAVIRFNDFAFALKDKVMKGDKLQWNGIGVLSKGLAGEIRFEPQVKNQAVGLPVAAVKVLREKAEHTVRVGEDYNTSAHMIELLNPAEEKKSYWWAAALILLLLSFIYAAYHFSVNGMATSAAANQQKADTEIATPTHK
jgi:hypothetical protein